MRAENGDKADAERVQLLLRGVGHRPKNTGHDYYQLDALDTTIPRTTSYST